MAKTFNQLATDFTTITRDDAATNLTLGKSLINTFTKQILAMRAWVWNRGSYTDITVGGQWRYPKPYNAERLEGVKVTVDTVNYYPKEISTRGIWVRMSRSVVTSDVPQYFWVNADHYELYPTPSNSANEITIYFQKRIFDLAETDYTTGTVSRSAGSRTVFGTGTVFTDAMVGRYIQFTDDPYWDKISESRSAGVLLTERESRTATDDGTYTISELMPLPFGFEELPLWKALAVYFHSKENPVQAKQYEEMYERGMRDLMGRDSKTSGNVLTKEELADVIGLIDPNKYPRNME